MTTYYATAWANGPVSIRLDAPDESSARAQFAALREDGQRSAIDDAEDDLEIDSAESMTPDQWDAALLRAGCRSLDRLTWDTASDAAWWLWEGPSGDTTPTDAQLEGLRVEAGQAGDDAQVELCERALEGAADARAECARVIEAARAMADGE